MYVNKSCVNCNRHRVIKLDSGDEVCEKCDWNQITNDYNHTLQKEMEEMNEEMSKYFEDIKYFENIQNDK